MPNYDYEIVSTGEIIEVMQSVKDDTLKELYSPKKKKNLPCKRLISQNTGVIFKGDGWTIPTTGYGKRGYKGQFQDKIRDAGTPVEAPACKGEADRFFQSQVDNGLLDKVPASINFAPGAKPQTTEQMLDKKYKPK